MIHIDKVRFVYSNLVEPVFLNCEDPNSTTDTSEKCSSKQIICVFLIVPDGMGNALF